MTKATLTQRLQDFLEDDDDEYTGSIDDLISLGETRIAKELNVDAMRELVTGTIAQGANTLARSSAIIGVLWFNVTSAGRQYPVLLRGDSWIRDRYPSGETGRPQLYGIQDEATWLLGPTADVAYDYSMMTEQRVVGLTDTTETWISTRHDDLLFYACALESGVFHKDSEEYAMYEKLYLRGLDVAKAEVARGRSDGLNLSR